MEFITLLLIISKLFLNYIIAHENLIYFFLIESNSVVLALLRFV